MRNDKLRIGMLGSRFAADFHADCYRRDPRVELVAVAGRDEKRLRAYAEKWKVPRTFTDYLELLKCKDIDVVALCTPNATHAQMVQDAAQAGKHVICEKPLATNLADAKAAVAACAKAKVKLFYAEDWCFAPALLRVEEAVREGAVGEVLYLKAKECHNGTHSPYAKNKDSCGGGCLIHLAIHPIGWALHFLGKEGKNPCVEVIGKANLGGKDNYVHTENGGEDFALGIMKFKEGQHAFIEGNYITVGGMDDKVEIYGSAGRIGVDLTFGSPVSVYSRPGYSYAIEKADNTLGWTKPAVDEFYNLGYVKELQHFVDCILEDRQPHWGVSGAAGLECVRIVEAMYRSNVEGKTVALPR